jgi:hypothetical protein
MRIRTPDLRDKIEAVHTSAQNHYAHLMISRKLRTVYIENRHDFLANCG